MKVFNIILLFILLSCSRQGGEKLIIDLHSGDSISEVESKLGVELKSEYAIKEVLKDKNYSIFPSQFIEIEGIKSLTENQRDLILAQYAEVSFKGNGALATLYFIDQDLYYVSLDFKLYNSKDASDICNTLIEEINKTPGNYTKENSKTVREAFTIRKESISLWCNAVEKYVSITSSDEKFAKAKLSKTVKNSL